MNLLSFFHKKDTPLPVRVKLKLVSLHIPKTAGTSFRKTLEAAYGEDTVIRLDIPLQRDRVKINNELYSLEKLPEGTSVVHGHFNAVELRDRFPEVKLLQTVTWVRHPVDRVISNYFYLEKRLAEELDEAGKNLNILGKMQRTLLEYARAEVSRNRQHKFLKGSRLEDFDFVGVLEHYAEDLEELGKRLDWDKVEQKTVNVTAKEKPIVSDEDREEIERLNSLDMAIYEHALHLRTRRKEKPKIDLISIHVPKTAGTSFYQSLREVYGPGVTKAISRGNLTRTIERFGSLEDSLTGEKKVIHGHVYYPEIADLHQAYDAKVIAWLRDPVERVISNYRFFKAGLVPPFRRQRMYELNKNRINESLETYVEKEETQNRMSKFLSGIEVDDLYFVGVLEHYDEDLNRLGRLLGWPALEPHVLNVSGVHKKEKYVVDEALRQKIADLNQKDIVLYNAAMDRRKREMNV